VSATSFDDAWAPIAVVDPDDPLGAAFSQRRNHVEVVGRRVADDHKNLVIDRALEVGRRSRAEHQARAPRRDHLERAVQGRRCPPRAAAAVMPQRAVQLEHLDVAGARRRRPARMGVEGDRSTATRLDCLFEKVVEVHGREAGARQCELSEPQLQRGWLLGQLDEAQQLKLRVRQLRDVAHDRLETQVVERMPRRGVPWTASILKPSHDISVRDCFREKDVDELEGGRQTGAP
jgi:hypothetical protein